MNTAIRKHKPWLWLIVLMGIVQSCTKTEYTDYEENTLNRILEYRVTNATRVLFGAIDNENNSITVYIPYYLGIEYLNAEIKLDEGAKLLDSEGNEINLDGGLDPIRVGSDTIRYTVVPASGSPRTYSVVQNVLSHGDSLQATYAELAEGEDVLLRAANQTITIVGNFESSNSTAQFYLTNKATGEVHDSLIVTTLMTPGNDGYRLDAYISPYADPGEYTVRIAHQGRSTDLPDLKVFHTQYPVYSIRLASSVHWTPGDTARFTITLGSELWPSVMKPMDRMYMKIRPNDAFERGPYDGVFTVPETFPESMYNQEIEMEIVSQDRTHIAAIFPDLPPGVYKSNMSIGVPFVQENGQNWSYITDTNIGFYVDFAGNIPGYPKGYNIARPNAVGFTVLPKE